MARSRLHIYRKVTLPLPCKPAAELRRTQRGEPNVRLYRDAREVRSMQTEIPRPGHFAILLFG